MANSFSFIYSTTFSVKYFCSKLRKTKMHWLQPPPPPPPQKLFWLQRIICFIIGVIVPVYIEFTGLTSSRQVNVGSVISHGFRSPWRKFWGWFLHDMTWKQTIHFFLLNAFNGTIITGFWEDHLVIHLYLAWFTLLILQKLTVYLKFGQKYKCAQLEFDHTGHTVIRIFQESHFSRGFRLL